MIADDDVIEIKLRALATIEAKFRIAGPNLEELDVNAYELVKCLLEWLQRKPVTDAERVLQLLIALLNVGQFVFFFFARNLIQSVDVMPHNSIQYVHFHRANISYRLFRT